MAFDELFLRVAGDWPAEIDLQGDRLERIAATIDSGYSGLPDGAMLSNLNQSICEVLQQAAGCFSSARLAQLRADAVRKVFDRRLQLILSYPELEYEENDISLIKSYFSETH